MLLKDSTDSLRRTVLASLLEELEIRGLPGQHALLVLRGSFESIQFTLNLSRVLPPFRASISGISTFSE